MSALNTAVRLKKTNEIVLVKELEEWVETIIKTALKKHVRSGSKNDRFNWPLHAYLAQIRKMGCNIDFSKIEELTINGIKFIKAEENHGKQQKTDAGGEDH